jgi:sugar/nucleoside kinase (ribokinase family)/nucleoside 2-deoxyribosyltransferase
MSYDIVVIGEAAVDVLEDFPQPIKRPGGAFYSVLAARAKGLNVGMLAAGSEFGQNEFVSQIEDFGIDLKGIQPKKDSCIEYRIQNANEILPQVIVNKLVNPVLSLEFPSEYTDTKSLLIYPTDGNTILFKIASEVKENKGLVCLDLQHDITDLSSLKDLLAISDVIFASRNELLQITESRNDFDALSKLWKFVTSTIIVKYGMGGSIIYQKGNESIQIPAFLANFKCTIGAGDVYNAIFITSFLQGINIKNAGNEASLAASIFSENINFPAYYYALEKLDSRLEKTRRDCVSAHPEQLIKIGIYITGNFLSLPMKNWVDMMTLILESRGFRVFSPYRDAGLLSSLSSLSKKSECFHRDVDGLDHSDIIVALLDSPGRGGSYWEIGYAYSKNIPIFGLLTENEPNISNMTFISCKTISSNLPDLLNNIFGYLAENPSLLNR